MCIQHFVLDSLCRNIYSRYILEIVILVTMFAITSIFCFHLAIIHIYFSRQLQCDRVTLHNNLFSSYILNGLAWILYYTLASFNAKVLAGNPVSKTVFSIYLIPKLLKNTLLIEDYTIKPYFLLFTALLQLQRGPP